MSFDEIDALVPGKSYQFVAILGGGDYPVGGLATLLEVTADTIALKMEYMDSDVVDSEWSLKNVVVPKNKMQWMRRLTVAPPKPRDV
jgi:hypothetical protein